MPRDGTPLLRFILFHIPVFNLAEGIDVEQSEAKLADYERKNRDAIAVNAAKKVTAGYDAPFAG
jgi:hypothetical protein